MIVLSHRGYWKKLSERNKLIAFKRSFSLGFGTETDIRDYKGELVIAHDVADKNCLTIKDFFEMYTAFSNTLPLAFNIKADGLQLKLKKVINKCSIKKYFVFDMSVPDALQYCRYNINFFTRQSEYEREPSLYEDAQGVWLDEFNGHWINEYIIKKHIKNQKQLCIVSPDLHKRDYKKEWKHYKQIEKKLGINDIMICTDHPEKANRFFNE